MIETALILPLATSIDWGRSLQPDAALSEISDLSTPLFKLDGDDLVINKYAFRDRELSYRDIVLASAAAGVAFRLSTTWNFNPNTICVPGPVVPKLVFNTEDLNTPRSKGSVTYVGGDSVASDAILTDRDLYERDLLIAQELGSATSTHLKGASTMWTYEVGYSGTVVTASQDHNYTNGYGVKIHSDTAIPSVLTPGPDPALSVQYYVHAIDDTTFSLHSSQADALLENPVSPVNFTDHGSGKQFVVFSGFNLTVDAVWSPAEGSENSSEVHHDLPLSYNLFKAPDQNLAHRDNILAAHAAKLISIINNPFEHANRLLVRVTHSENPFDPDNREPEVYSIIQDSDDVRVWVLDPLLNGRCRLIYRRSNKTLQWITENPGQLHVPQPAQYTIDGIASGQKIALLAEMPPPFTVNYWRQKSSRLVFPGRIDGGSENNVASVPDPGLGFVNNSGNSIGLSNGDLVLMSAGSTSLPLTNAIFSPSPEVENLRISAIVTPTPEIKLLGSAGSFSPSAQIDALGGAIYQSAPTTGIWKVKLPVGNWELEVVYAAADLSPSSFPVRIKFGNDTVSITPLRYGVVVGSEISEKFTISAGQNGRPALQDLSIQWTSGLGKLVIRKVIFRSSLSTKLRYRLTCSVGSLASSSVDIIGYRNQPAVVHFNFLSSSSLTSPTIRLGYAETQDAPLAISKIQLLKITKLQGSSVTPGAFGFEPWRLEMRNRVSYVLEDAFARFVESYLVRTGEIEEGAKYEVSNGLVEYCGTIYGGTGNTTFTGTSTTFYEVADGHPTVIEYELPLPEFREEDANEEMVWVPNSTAGWVDAIRTQAEDFDLAFREALPSDIGKPSLVPAGIYLRPDGTVAAPFDTRKLAPTIQAFQPWMAGIGVLVLHDHLHNPGDRMGWVGDFGSRS